MPNTQFSTLSDYLNAIQKQVLIFDGAMGTELQKLRLTAQDYGGERYIGCNDALSIFSPQAVERVHRSYLEAGANVIETNTFRANPITLKEYELTERCEEINHAAARLARRLADEFNGSGQKRFVAGSMGPTGILLSLPDQNPHSISFDQVAAAYQQQAAALLAGGVDLFLLETSQDILEVKAALIGIRKACQEAKDWRPVQAQVTLDTNGRMLAGTDISAVQVILDGAGVDVIGLNCSTGPEHMRPSLEILVQRTALPISCMPNAGMPVNVDGEAVYPLKAEDFAKQMVDFVERLGVNVVGGCCGTTPNHIRQLVERIGKQKPATRVVERIPCLASALRAVDMRQQPSPFLIGERLNTQGSRVFKKAMLTEDFTTAAQLAEQQIAGGAHGIDLCTALTERNDEAQLMTRLVQTIAPISDAALVIDSTDPSVMEAALKAAPGRCLLNSVHLEDGGMKARIVFRLAVEHNAAILALTMDEEGMARSAERKLEIAQRITTLAWNEFGIAADRLVFDPLTFTVASGDVDSAGAAQETLRAIQLIKSKIPGAMTSLGVSNVSFGLAPATRALLNSVFLHLAVTAGLDMAIVNPTQIRAVADIPADMRQTAEEVLYRGSSDALSKLIALGEKEKIGGSAESSDLPTDLQERLRQRIIRRRKDGLDEDVEEFIQPNIEGRAERAVRLLNEVLLPAMQEVGERFAKGELILPFVLQAAEVMKQATDRLQCYLEAKTGATRGKIVLATVYGDIHDIGKNLVHTILANNGYEIIDLGKQVPVEEIVRAAKEEQADAVGLSALLVSTSQQMSLVIRSLQGRGMKLPVLVGGAAVNAPFAQRINMDENGEQYAGGVYFCRDAFDALQVLEKQPTVDAYYKTEKPNHTELKPTATVRVSKIEKVSILPEYQPAPIPTPPFWGTRVINPLPLNELFDLIDIKSLYRLSWGARNARGEKWEKLTSDFDLRLKAMKISVLEKGWLQPRGVYGFFHVHSDGSALYIHEPATDQVIGTMPLARKTDVQNHSLADYFSPKPEDCDVAAFQVVTAGRAAGDFIRELQSDGDFTEAYFSHGLAVQITEAAADYIHNLVRSQLGIPLDQGKRYSWGYPAIPDLTQHRLVFQLLGAQESLDLGLTSACQIIPEHSTAALVVHHPNALYF